MERFFEENEVVTSDKLNQLARREELIQMQLDLHKKLLEKFYSKENLSEIELLRKAEIEFIISYLEIDDLYETITSPPRTEKN